MILAVDPGMTGSGASLWRTTGQLVKAAYVRPGAVPLYFDLDDGTRVGGAGPTMPERWRAMADALAEWCVPVPAHAIVVEVPQVYRAARSKGSPQDLITLAGLVGAITQSIRGRRAHSYLPHEWKGAVPKEVTELRARKRLSADELKLVQLPAPSLRHNVWDAVGLGLHHLERLGVRARV